MTMGTMLACFPCIFMCFVRFSSLCVERCVEGGSGVRWRPSKTTNGGCLTPRTNPLESNPGVKKHVAQFMEMVELAFTACKQHGISGAGIAGPHWAEPGTAPVRETIPNKFLHACHIHPIGGTVWASVSASVWVPIHRIGGTASPIPLIT